MEKLPLPWSLGIVGEPPELTEGFRSYFIVFNL
jgi:hypothetical protein